MDGWNDHHDDIMRPHSGGGGALPLCSQIL